MELHARRPCSEFPNDTLERDECTVGQATVPSPAPSSSDTDPTDLLMEGSCDDDIEIVDELIFDAIDEPVFAGLEEPSILSEESCRDVAQDAFSYLVQTLTEIASKTGGPEASAITSALLAAARIESLPLARGGARTESWIADGLLRRAEDGLGREDKLHHQVQGWRALLLGESDDFEACGGTMLDEWCVALLVRVLGPGARADSLRRELRSRGVAAFGVLLPGPASTRSMRAA